MFNTIILKKKFIIFFLISLLFSTVLIIYLNYPDKSDGNNTKNDSCQRELLVRYNYNKILQTNAASVSTIHTYLKSYLTAEIMNYFKDEFSKGEIVLDKSFIKFNGKNCFENFNKVISEFENIKKITFVEFNNLRQHLKNNEIKIELTDELTFMATTPKNIMSIEAVKRIDEKEYVKIIIQFLTILIILNLGYFFISKVRFEIK